MKLYKKINRIIQVLLIICFILMVFCPGFVVVTPHVFASESDEALAKISPHEKNNKGGMNMEEKGKLTKEEGEYLISVARKTIESRLFNREIPLEKGLANEKYLEKRGTFVTLTINNDLRGCIGHIVPQETLLEGIRVNAINAAFKDPRFAPLSKGEWDRVKVEISILTEPAPLKYNGAEDLLNKLKPGIDGLIIEKGYQSATFLPQVWDQLPEKEEFLGHLCMKAGLNTNEWKKGTLTVYTYQVQAFEEEH